MEYVYLNLNDNTMKIYVDFSQINYTEVFMWITICSFSDKLLIRLICNIGKWNSPFSKVDRIMTDIFEKGDQPCPIEFNPICTCHYSLLKPIPGNTKYQMYQKFQSIKTQQHIQSNKTLFQTLWPVHRQGDTVHLSHYRGFCLAW